MPDTYDGGEGWYHCGKKLDLRLCGMLWRQFKRGGRNFSRRRTSQTENTNTIPTRRLQ